MVLDATLLSTQHYNVRITVNGAIQRKKWCPPQHPGVVAIEKGTFGSVSTQVANFTLLPYNTSPGFYPRPRVSKSSKNKKISSKSRSNTSKNKRKNRKIKVKVKVGKVKVKVGKVKLEVLRVKIKVGIVKVKIVKIASSASVIGSYMYLYHSLFWQFFKPALADGFSQEFEYPQLSSSLQDTSQYSGRYQQCSSLDGLHPSSSFQVLHFL